MRVMVFTALVFSSSSLFAQVADSIAKDDVVYMQDDDPVMSKAFAAARASLDDFLKTAQNPSADQTGFALKVGIMKDDDTEYFWVSNFKSKGGSKFEGEINNEPRIVDTVKLGRSQIVDWTYVDEKQMKMMGNFSMCALLSQEPKEEAEEIKRRFKLDCSKVTG